MNGWIGGGVNGEARARQSRKIVFLFGKKKDFSGFGGNQKIFQRFRRFCESEKGRHASSRVFCSVLKKKCFRALLKVEQYFIHTRM